MKKFILGAVFFASCGSDTPPPVVPPAEGVVRNILYLEVNNANPLNALEYLRADGTPFFSGVVLFASNINYDASADRVYLHHNPNCAALLAQSEVYLQPLRRAGIEVYLGVLGNHDAAGVAQLSKEGAEQFAAEVAGAVTEYKLDGVAFDDEYSASPDLTNPLFAVRSGAAASRLLYETKKRLGASGKVITYEYGMLYSSRLEGVDGHEPTEFVDIVTPDYALAASPVWGGGLDICAGWAVELNSGRGRASATEAQARAIKAAGYGYYMWFALDPVYDATKYALNLEALSRVCRGLYDQELSTPARFYKKTGEGVYDPAPYSL